MSARTSLCPLFNQIGERLVDQCRKLSSFALRDGFDRGQIRFTEFQIFRETVPA